MKQIAIIGGGPAGLRAAEVATGDGQVTVYDAKPSVGRKFLVAGKGGLNLTKAEDFDKFVTRYSGPDLPAEKWKEMLAAFDSKDLREWAAGLGVETFVASTGRVYPREMKAAPLLRRWVERLRNSGVQFAVNHRWTGMRCNGRVELCFETPEGLRVVLADSVVLALGGGSWPETGSDGGGIAVLAKCGVAVAPFQPANCGWKIAWPDELLALVEGLPLKNIALRAGGQRAVGELLITRYGLEGGPIYQLSPQLRAMENPTVEVDFKPGVSREKLMEKMGPARRNFLSEASRRWKLNPTALAILSHHPDRQAWTSAEAMSEAVKCCSLTLLGPQPIAEAISSAGGVRWTELDSRFMIKSLPGVFVAGEMIDWEAPTGGYLMQGCFATGTRAGLAAREWGM